MITIKLARGDNYESVPLRLPTTSGEMGEAFAALDAASRYAGEVQIIGVDSGVPSLAKYLKGAGLTDSDAFDKLNRLAEKIDGMDERQRDIFSGALDAESADSLDDVLRVSDSLEAYTFVPNVRSDEELGRYTGTVSRIALNRTRYVAIFEGTPLQPVTAPEDQLTAQFNWAAVLVPFGIVALAGAGIGAAVFIRRRREADEDGGESA